ncbi:acyl-CoA dehydrogenase family protein, partial [Nocardioides sp.]|uniref:acyl-CoA dehydrogenase family protein n=1 Tax=Nocardioides sp. TaxID=35761 RepID=UPI002734C698
ELCRVLVEVGRTVAPVPLAAHGATALAVAELGTAEQCARWLPGAAGGHQVLTAALSEDRTHLPEHPTTTATPSGDGWELTGTKTTVPSGAYADLFVISAEGPDGPGLFLVEPGDAGVTVETQRLSDGDTVARLRLEAVALGADRLLGGTPGGLTRLHQLLVVATAAQQLGVTEGAIRLTATYAKEREQFGRPIGTFQAVSQRLADGYIDTLGQGLTLWQAAWRVSESLPATAEVATAKLWAADAGHRIAHTTVHVHGGVGIDLDGVAHRYFTAAKRFEFLFGGATEQSLAVGRVLASEPA